MVAVSEYVAEQSPLALVVEDDDCIRDALVTVLELEGYRARPASTLAEARVHLAEGCPTVLVVDRMLPDGLADELLEELARRSCPPPTVLVSASPAAPDVARSFDISFVAKPFDLESLMSAIDTSVKRGRKPSKPPPAI
jgi:DNA-binding response OmpR family regulator